MPPIRMQPAPPPRPSAQPAATSDCSTAQSPGKTLTKWMSTVVLSNGAITAAGPCGDQSNPQESNATLRRNISRRGISGALEGRAAVHELPALDGPGPDRRFSERTFLSVD